MIVLNAAKVKVFKSRSKTRERKKLCPPFQSSSFPGLRPLPLSAVQTPPGLSTTSQPHYCSQPLHVPIHYKSNCWLAFLMYYISLIDPLLEGPRSLPNLLQVSLPTSHFNTGSYNIVALFSICIPNPLQNESTSPILSVLTDKAWLRERPRRLGI